MAELLTQSWTSEQQLEQLARMRRNREIVRGVITSVGIKKARVLEGDKYVEKEMEVAVFQLEVAGVTAYCPATEFSDYEYRSLNGFTGSIQEFVIEHLDLDYRTAVVSVRKADQMKKEALFQELDSLQASGQLENKVFKGVVSGFNPNTRRVFVRVQGADCFMLPNDYSWERASIETKIQRGETIDVKILRFDKEQNLVQVSRRHTLEDPFKKLEKLKEMETVAGRVSGVSPIHGIFIQLDVGLEVKGVKPSYLEEPIVGDIVSCAIRHIDSQKRQARVVIVGYPRGKKKRKDVASFLFE